MLTSFTAQNFRLFTKLEIPHLSRVNLFVGRNNAGKSALLEAIEVYASKASFDTLLSIVASREETWGRTNSSTESLDSPASANDFLRHLFNGHQFPVVDGEGIVVGPLYAPDAQLHLTVAAYGRVSDVEAGPQRRRISAARYQELLEEGAPFYLNLIATEAERTRRIIELNGRLPANSFRESTEDMLPIQTVPTQQMQPAQVAALWDATGLTDLAQEVIRGLQLIEPAVSGIAFVKASGRYARTSERIAMVKLATQPLPLPLKSMGDGITRLLHIILALVNAPHGIVLVDEFENGLHWSVQEKVWEIVFQLAERLDVQVFATTHSRDCVQAFQAAWEKYQNLGTYYRMDADRQGEVSAQQYSLNTLADSIAADVETR